MVPGSHSSLRVLRGCTAAPRTGYPKATVVKPPRYEPELNESFQQMGAHYGSAVMPARVRHPLDKPKAESTVRLYTTWVIARLRHRIFFSLRELNVAIRELVELANKKPFKKNLARARSCSIN